MNGSRRAAGRSSRRSRSAGRRPGYGDRIMSDEVAQKAAWRLVLLVCIAQTLVQIGAFFWPALLPQLAPTWALSNSAAGWITAAFYGAYMLAVPLLVTLTDRIDPKRLYLLGVGLTITGHVLFGWLADGFWSALACRALAGVGWAGTYMTGLKLLADRVDARMMS
ncbi:MAG: MFS transporter, partial [Gammaproteobacteria bacterium]|nr:MFS transporter [Gammaproteobacteria bacterium]